MLFHLFLHGWWLLEHGPLQSGFWWKRCCLEAKFAKIRKSGKIYGKSYFSRRLRMPEDGVEMGHRGPTPPHGAGRPRPRQGVVWPPWPTPASPLWRISSSRNPKTRGATTERFRRLCGAENTERERSLRQTDFCRGNSFPERGDRRHQHHHQAGLHRDHHHHHHHLHQHHHHHFIPL